MLEKDGLRCDICGKTGQWPWKPFLTTEDSSTRPTSFAAVYPLSELSENEAAEFIGNPIRAFGYFKDANKDLEFHCACPGCLRIGESLEENGHSEVARMAVDEEAPRILVTDENGCEVIGTARAYPGMRLNHPDGKVIFDVDEQGFVIANIHYPHTYSRNYGPVSITIDELRTWDHSIEHCQHGYSIHDRSHKDPTKWKVHTFPETDEGADDIATYMLGRSMNDNIIRKRGRVYTSRQGDVLKMKEELKKMTTELWRPNESAHDFRPR